MLKTKCVGDNYKMLVTVLTILVTNNLYLSTFLLFDLHTCETIKNNDEKLFGHLRHIIWFISLQTLVQTSNHISLKGRSRAILLSVWIASRCRSHIRHPLYRIGYTPCKKISQANLASESECTRKFRILNGIQMHQIH